MTHALCLAGLTKVYRGGYALEIGELLVGVALIAATLVWLLRYDRLSERACVAVVATTNVASLGGIFMAVNFHIANGAPHAWLIPKSGFDESVDLDGPLPAVELVMIGGSHRLLALTSRKRTLTDRNRAYRGQGSYLALWLSGFSL